jgi:hypothetical protein
MVDEMNAQDTPQLGRPRFYDLCVMYALYYDTMLLIASQAGVTKEVIDNMFLGNPVKRSDAVAVLAAFSQTVGHTWTIDNVKVPVLLESEGERHE